MSLNKIFNETRLENLSNDELIVISGGDSLFYDLGVAFGIGLVQGIRGMVAYGKWASQYS